MTMNLLIAAVATFFAWFVIVPVIFWLLRIFGLYAIVEERTCNVYVLFGKVVAVLDEPGLHILLFKLGLKAPIVRWLGRLYVLDMRIDQQYLRSQPVNSEEGAPMGIGIWYEMFISDPVAFLFKNADPRGSLATNVSNSTVRCLSNLKLADCTAESPRHEPDRAHRSLAAVPRVGIQVRIGLHPQGPLPRRANDPAD